MKISLNHFETDCLLQAVHYYVMHLRKIDELLGSEDYHALVNINKYLLDAVDVEIIDNLPF